MSFEVHPYSLEKLKELFRRASSSFSGKVSPGLDGKSHFQYFKGYFDHLQARTIVAEFNYVDRDYLDDFAYYYVRCFDGYSRTCTRLHFFSISFDTAAFEALITGDGSALTEGELQSSYLGFVVAKPLPLTAVGRTCLRTYPSNGQRHFPVTRRYTASLYGIPLSVESLAFQEQDHVVAACATSALWSAFQATGMKFQHQIPAPVQITRFATQNSPTQQRTIPNTEGLTPLAMAEAIRHVGLEPYVVGVEQDVDQFLLRSATYAYVAGGIPPLLIIELLRQSSINWEHIGFHAVAVTGFAFGRDPCPYGTSGFLARSSCITKLYVHDDQVGPFARMDLDGLPVQVARPGQGNVACTTLSTGWAINGVLGLVRARPLFLLIPVYHKIRLTYGEIRDLVVAFDAFVKGVAAASGNPLAGPLEWDIHIESVSDFKQSIRSSTDLDSGRKAAVLFKDLPRFIWRAAAEIDGQRVLELLFDATDIQQGSLAAVAIEYEDDLGALIRAALSNPGVRDTVDPELLWRVLRVFN